jgi:hypothetical protein
MKTRRLLIKATAGLCLLLALVLHSCEVIELLEWEGCLECKKGSEWKITCDQDKIDKLRQQGYICEKYEED